MRTKNKIIDKWKVFSHMVLQRWMILALTLNCCTANLMGVGENSYGDDAIITDMSEQILRDANMPMEDILREVGTERELRQTFKRKYLTPASEGEQISEDQITQQTMDYIRKIAANPNADESKRLSIIRLNGKTVLALQNNVEALQAEIDGLWGSQIGWGVCAGAGLVILGGAAIVMPGKYEGQRTSKYAVMSLGGFVTLVGGGKSLSVWKRKGDLETVMQTKQGMKQDWQELFKVR